MQFVSSIFLLKWVVFCKKCNFFGENGQNFSFAGPKCLNRLMTPKILLWWKNACPNFFSVGFKVKKCTQKIFDITNSLGCGTPLVILFGAKVQFSRHFLILTDKLLVLHKKCCWTKSNFCKIYNFAQQNFNVGSIVWPEIPKSHFKNGH